MTILPGETREAISESAPFTGHEPGARGNVHQSQVAGNAPCSGTLHEFVGERSAPAKFLSHRKPSVRYVSPSLAWGEKASTLEAA